MRSINKILFIGMFIFLLMGAVCAATDIDSLKAPKGFSEIKNGTATFEKNNEKCILYIDRIDSKEFQDFLSKHKDHIKYEELGNDTYSYTDEDNSNSGAIEKVKIDNADYVVYTQFEGKKELSKKELKFSKNVLILFNEANNLKAEAGLKESLK